MAVKNYMINDKWLDIAKQNIVEVESTDGVIGSVKVNGEEYGGSGGESDFSTAELVLTNNSGIPFEAYGATFYNEEEYESTGSIYESGVSGTIPVILYKGKAYIDLVTSINKSAVVLSGDITGVNDVLLQTKYKGFNITGDCTITIS